MSDRRNHDRRRRVIYTSGLEPIVVNAASIRRTEELRQARRPAAVYGARVRRRLRGRWYSLVPVRQREFVLMAAALTAISVVMVIAHLATERWSLLSTNPILARPFRLDQPDSLGRFFQTSLLIYQLRRYRLDDYQGQYRLWRTTLILSALAALNCHCGLIEWSGSAIDAVLGRRLALSGANWVRMITTMGLFILGIRVLVDVRRSRTALIALMTASALILIPETVRWNVSRLGPWIVLTAPTLAATTYVIGLLAYLRVLYREVRDIQDGPSMGQRLRKMKWSIVSKEESEEDEEPQADAPRRSQQKRSVALQNEVAEPDDAKTTKRGLFTRLAWFGRQKSNNDGQPTARQQRAAAKSAASQAAQAKKAAQIQESRELAEQKLAAKKQAEQKLAAQKLEAHQQTVRNQASRKPTPPSSKSADEEDTDEPVATEPKPRRFGLGRFFKSKSQSPAETVEKNERPQFEPISDESEDDDDSYGDHSEDPENIDPDSEQWATLNRSDKRRLKKQLRRQGRAA
jgi:hypothetical protein